MAGSEEAGEPPQIREAFERTVRLVSSARLREAVMAPLADSDAELALLGVSESTWDRMKAGTWEGSLGQDQLTRASALIGLFKGLHLLFANDMADRWPKLENRAPLFDRRSPIGAMIEGGIPRMLETRQYIDALRGGL